MHIETIGVIGSGTMGGGIALCGVINGFPVTVYDVNESILQSSRDRMEKSLSSTVAKGRMTEEEKTQALVRLRFSSNLDAFAKLDCVIEAVPEKRDLKKELFLELSRVCREDAVLATNTSSLSVTGLSMDVKYPERFAGMHFFNPAHIMKLVEVIVGRFSSEEAVTSIFKLSRDLRKVPVRVRDTPGFIVNRVARSYYNEALKILEDRLAEPEVIDRIMKSYGFKMGPFELMDLIGHDVNYEVTKSLFDAYHCEARYRPSHLQKALVDAGTLGRKSGRGFYSY